MKQYKKQAVIAGMLVVLGLVAPSVQAVLVSQIDTFDSNTMGWAGGASPTHVANGGPDGGGDGFLQISRTASAFHLSTINKTQWTGDYLTTGVTGIEVDLNATGPDAVNVRLMLWGDGGVWASSSLTPISAGWNHYSFGLTASDLVYVDDDTNSPVGTGGGTGILNDTLQNVNIIQLRHDGVSPTPPGFHPPHILATLRIDNFEAVPEPGTLGYMLVALGGTLIVRKKKSFQ